jgi:site-specific DNA recombinase
MAFDRIVHFIPPTPKKPEKRVGIYCRVSTNSTDQLNSLASQVSVLTRITAAKPDWLLVDAYIDIASSKTGSFRKDFTRMLTDCKSHDLDIILTKNISRFGRDTLEILEALDQLKQLGIRVIFEQEQLDTDEIDHQLMISIIETINQAENESRSYNIKWGIEQHAAQGTSKLYNRKCYGFVNATDGSLIADAVEAKNVKMIFNMYLKGKSVIGIVSELERQGIKSPAGKVKWCKRTIDVMLSNGKYIGNVRLLDDGKHASYFLAEDNNPTIMSKEIFQAVQIEKQRRSNITKVEDSKQRKSKKYSSKKQIKDNKIMNNATFKWNPYNI